LKKEMLKMQLVRLLHLGRGIDGTKVENKESDCGLFSILHLSKKSDIMVESVLGRR
jgi:hypothetical protein